MRASLKSNVERFIDPQRVVIIDSMNYIKGFRYELYCLVRAAQTTLCLVFCDTDIEFARKIADDGGYENPFPVEMFNDYASRMERPNQGQRWDKPLFHLRLDEQTPLDDIANAIFSEGSKPRNPISTKPVSFFFFMCALTRFVSIRRNFLTKTSFLSSTRHAKPCLLLFNKNNKM
jgi:protein KTI12